MKYIMLILFLFISCNTITTKYIMYPKDGKIDYTWCDKIIETNENIYMIKKYYNCIKTNKIEWYINLQPKQYKNIILRID